MRLVGVTTVAGTVRDPHGWRAGAVRVLANSLLVLLSYEVVSIAAGVAQVMVTGATLPETPVEGVPLVVVVAAFLLIRWIYVLPGLLAVLVGLEFVGRRVPHARALTAIVAFAPMFLWELTQSPGGGVSGQGAVLGWTAVLFAIVARVPARLQGRSTDDRGAAQPSAGPAVAPR